MDSTGGYSDLFNGNISAMSTTLKTAGEQTMLYRYDQLNRIKTAVSSQNTYQTGYSYDANGNILSLLRNDHTTTNTIDNLSYSYNTNVNNRLNQIRDNIGNDTGLNSSPTPFSYQYDNIGNLIEDEEKGITSVKWTVYGKVESVEKNDGTMISYKYDATGNRIYKKVNATETHYVRDASGNLMATYQNQIVKDFVIYGSSRLGVYNGNTSEGKRTLGNKKYELSNHLGNVLSVISDNKIGIDNLNNDLIADYYEPYIVSESDYYPFGMQMGSRSFQNQDYLFAFQGQETNEQLGTVHYKYREADIITGRFWSVDPLAPEYPHNSPFAFSENRVIDGVELEGLEYAGINDEQINEQIFTDYAQIEVAKNTVATFEDLFYSIKNVIYMTSGIPIRDRKQADGSRKVETVFTNTWSEAGANILHDLGDLMNVFSLGSRGNPAALLVKTGGKGNTAKKAADAAADAVSGNKKAASDVAEGLNKSEVVIPAAGTKGNFDKGNFISGIAFKGSYELIDGALEFNVKVFRNLIGEKGGMVKTVQKAEELAKAMGVKNININFKYTGNSDILTNSRIRSTGETVPDYAAEHGYKYIGNGVKGLTITWTKSIE